MTAVVDKNTPYESLFLVPPETAQEKMDGFIEKVKTTISKEGGMLKGVQVWGRRRLAYPIKRNKDGLYVYVDFDGPSAASDAVSRLFNVTDFILRSITVYREEFDPPRKAPPRRERSEGPRSKSASPSNPEEKSEKSPS